MEPQENGKRKSATSEGDHQQKRLKNSQNYNNEEDETARVWRICLEGV